MSSNRSFREVIEQPVSINWLRVLVSVSAVAVIGLHLWLPSLKVDAVTFGLILVAILPWLAELIESAKLPGGWEIKFRTVREAGSKVTSAAPGSSSDAAANTGAPEGSVSFPYTDPNLALVAFRLEIEARVRHIARTSGVDDTMPLGSLLRSLARSQSLPLDVANGLQELVNAGNRAAHGARVESSVSAWAMDYGPTILSTLDKYIDDAEASDS